MEITFTDKKLEKLANDDKKMLKELGKARATILRRRLTQLEDATTLEDIRNLPGNYHELTSNRKGQWACNLDQPYRLVFTPHENPIPTNANGQYIWLEITGVEVIEIINYHKREITMAKQNQYFPQSRPHLGETLAEKLEEMEMGAKEFALRTGKPEKTITAILKGDSSITPDMAVQFENVTKIPAHFWMNHQRSYDEYIAREKRQAVIEEAVAWAKQFPLADMIKKGWLPPVATIQEKTMAMLAFFGFSNHSAWEDYYFKQQLKVAFRISLANTKEPHAISAWLRKGELQAAELEANDYSEKKFKGALPELKKVMAKHPKNFFNQLQRICLEAGVKVVHTPCINKAPISGSTRWLNDTPFIQLTDRYKRNDIFWFTFFHEAGHILLHGKKDIFLEDVEYSDEDKAKEAEADEFAINWTLTKEEEAEILDNTPLNDNSIKNFAKKFNTHPAIIIGRLQHKKLIPYSLGREYFESVIFD